MLIDGNLAVSRCSPGSANLLASSRRRHDVLKSDPGLKWVGERAGASYLQNNAPMSKSSRQRDVLKRKLA